MALTVLGSKSFRELMPVRTEEERDWNPRSRQAALSLVRHLGHPSAMALPDSPRPGGSGFSASLHVKSETCCKSFPLNNWNLGVGPSADGF